VRVSALKARTVPPSTAVVAMIAIGYHAVQAARLDPSTTLRDE